MCGINSYSFKEIHQNRCLSSIKFYMKSGQYEGLICDEGLDRKTVPANWNVYQIYGERYKGLNGSYLLFSEIVQDNGYMEKDPYSNRLLLMPDIDGPFLTKPALKINRLYYTYQCPADKIENKDILAILEAKEKYWREEVPSMAHNK